MKVTMNTDSVDIERHVIGIQVEDTTPVKRIGVFHAHTRETVEEATEIAIEIVRRVNAFDDMLAALEQFVRYACNGNHPEWGKYLATGAGSRMLAAIAKAKE